LNGSSSPFPDGRPSDLKSARVLVTGAAGFIGSHLVDALLERGALVRALDNFSTGRPENLAHCRERIEMVEGDLRDLPTCRRACAGIDVVFHEAALGSIQRSIEDPATTVAINVGGTVNLLAGARDAKVRRVIYASSSSVYGDSTALPKREGEEGTPLSPYAASKVMNEDLAALFGRCYGMELVGMRYFNVYGPRQDPEGPYAAVIPRFFKAYAAGQAPVIYGDGEQSRDFTFVADVVAANLLAAAASETALGRAYNVACGQRTSVNELALAVREAFGGGPEPMYQAARGGEVRHSAADVSLARQELGFVAGVRLAEGIVRTRLHYGGQDDRTSDVRDRAPGRVSGS
jgi:UDP-N-acetylglucosamine/UDP-N-acetyl-alpha-D-glucosaminouronate 4-epimerase